MSDNRRRVAAWGSSGVLLFVVALLSATALTGPGNEFSIRLIGCIISTLCLVLGAVCIGMTFRGLLHVALSGVGGRLQKQAGILDEAQERRHADLMSQVEESQDALRAVGDSLQYLREELKLLRGADEDASKALGSLARSSRLQTESIATIRKQMRVGVDGINRNAELTLAAQGIAVDGRDLTRKLLNVVRGESKSNRERVTRSDSQNRKLISRLDEAEGAQRRILNFLRKEGSIQTVLDRLQASEQRLLTSVEGGALTVAGELAGSVEQARDGLHVEMRTATEALSQILNSVESVESKLSSAAPRTESLLAEVGGIAQTMKGVHGSVIDLGRENSKALEQLGDTDALTLVEASLLQMDRARDEIETRTKVAFESQADAGELFRSLRASIASLQTRWDTLHHDWEAIADSARRGQANVKGEGTSTDLAPTMKSLVRLADVLKNDVKSLHRHVDRAGIDTVRQTEALLQLLPRMGTDVPRLPPSGGFAMTPDSLLLLSDLIAEHKPRTILELGSGTSTVWIGTFAASIGATVVSIDHLEEYLVRTRADLTDFSLGPTVDLRLAELVPTEVTGESKLWYALASFEDLSSIDMVIIDGPPESTGPAPRSPAFPLLRDKLSDSALLVVDDMHRDQEAQMVEAWISLDADLSKTKWNASRTTVLEYRRDI